jgi:hypothetical protein
VSTENDNSCQTTESKLDEAINAVKDEIDKLAKKQRLLEHSVRLLRLNKRDGVPWPGEEKQDVATK